ncbi:MAG: hypothetical protein ACQER9_02510 [Nanobdellota archaeon]
MSLDNLVQNLGEIMVYKNNVYRPMNFNTGIYLKDKGKKKNFSLLGNATQVVSENNGSLNNFDVFVKNCLIPLLNSSDKEAEKWKNSFFDSIAPKFNPIYLNKSGCYIFSDKKKSNKLYTNIKGDNFGISHKLSSLDANMKFLLEETSFGLTNSNFRAKKIDNGYAIKAVYPEIILQYNGENYCFENIGLRVNLFKRLSNYVFEKPVAINNKKHPFIFDCGKICFNGEDRWIQNNIDYKSSGLSTDLAFDIRKVFRITYDMLTKGYSKGCRPVRSIHSFNEQKV